MKIGVRGAGVSRFGEVGTFRAAASHMIAGVTDILLRLVDGVVQVVTTTRAGGGLLSLAMTEDGVGDGSGLVLIDQQGIAAGSSLSAPAMLSLVTLNGQERLVWTGGWQAQPGGWELPASGAFGSSFALSRGPSGVMTAQTFLERDGMTLAILTPSGSDRLEVWQIDARGRMVLLGSADLPGHGEQQVEVTALTTLRLGGQDFILSLSSAEESLRIWQLGSDGAITPVSQIGAGAGLGLSAPSALELVQIAGQRFALVAGAGSSSLSVVRIATDGQMALADHVIDTLDTRFQQVQAIATVELGGQVFVFAGGADDGVQAFQMLPDGRLVLAGQITRKAGLPLDNITAIEAVVVNGRIELVVVGEGAGLIRLTYAPGPVAAPQIGGAAGDVLTGDARADMLVGGGGADTLSGAAGDDVLADGAGCDLLTGGAGADLFTLSGDGAADTIRDFTPGEDRIDLSGWGRVYSISVVQKAGRDDCVVLRWGTEVLTIYAAAGQSLNPADLTSSDLFGLWHMNAPVVLAGQRIAGTAGVDTLIGSGGADTLVGSEGPDLLVGGSGRDLADYGDMSRGIVASLTRDAAAPLSGGVTQDRFESVEDLFGSQFDDRLGGNGLANLLSGRGGRDVLLGHAGNDRLSGGEGDDTLLGGAGADVLAGGAGCDLASWAMASAGVTIDLAQERQRGGEAEGDVLIDVEGIIGSGHADWLRGDAGANLLFGGRGDDRLEGDRGDDRLYGGDGADQLDGGKGDSTLDGGAGNDCLIAGRGANLVAGGSGSDWLLVTGKWGLRLDLAVTGPQDTLGYGIDRVSGIEHLRGGSGDDSLSGAAGGNRLEGAGGNDALLGRAGDDTLSGGDGVDTLDGGTGFDWAVFDGDAPVTVTLGRTDAQDTGAGLDLLTEIEGVIGGSGADDLRGDAMANRLWGSAGADRLRGEGGNDSLRGGAGADMLSGGAGADLVAGEDGNDRLVAGQGADRLYGGAGIDMAVLSGLGPVDCDLSRTGPQLHAAGSVVLVGVEGLTGGAQGDRLTGDAAANQLLGLQGDDVLSGAGGNDLLAGGAGRDRLSGGQGRDLLLAGTGADTLTGGAGADRFVFGGGQDRITDFAAAQGDRLVLDADGLHQVWGLSAAQVVQRFGRDMGDFVRLDFGAAGWVDFAGLGSLQSLQAAIEVI